jgi:hypothetical protein
MSMDCKKAGHGSMRHRTLVKSTKTFGLNISFCPSFNYSINLCRPHYAESNKPYKEGHLGFPLEKSRKLSYKGELHSVGYQTKTFKAPHRQLKLTPGMSGDLTPLLNRDQH